MRFGFNSIQFSSTSAEWWNWTVSQTNTKHTASNLLMSASALPLVDVAFKRMRIFFNDLNIMSSLGLEDMDI